MQVGFVCKVRTGDLFLAQSTFDAFDGFGFGVLKRSFGGRRETRGTDGRSGY